MNNVSFHGNIEIRNFSNGMMSRFIQKETSIAQDRKLSRDLYDKFGKIPVYGEKNTIEALNYLKNFVEDVTGIELPKINSNEKYFHIGKTSIILEEGIAKDKGHGGAYSVVIYPNRFCAFG